MVRLLIIDDEAAFRQTLAKALRNSGFEVVDAAGGTEGVRVASKTRPDLILCDVDMPDMDGYGVMTTLRKDTNLGDIPFIFLTGQSSPTQLRRGMNMGADDYVTKPVSLPDLIGAIRTRLQRWKTNQGNGRPETQSKKSDWLLVTTAAEKRLVKISEIRCLFAYGEYSWVHWNQNKKGAMFRKSLKQWLRELPAEQFIRVHRRAIVNLDFLERVELLPSNRMQIHLRDPAEPIPVSLRLAPELNRKLKQLGR